MSIKSLISVLSSFFDSYRYKSRQYSNSVYESYNYEEHDIEKVAEFEIQDGNCPGKKYKLECKCSEIFKIQSPQIRNVKQIQFYG